MTFEIQFIQASRCLTSVDSYTVLEIKKVKEIAKGGFASLLIARHNGDRFVLKKIFLNIEIKKENFK